MFCVMLYNFIFSRGQAIVRIFYFQIWKFWSLAQELLGLGLKIPSTYLLQELCCARPLLYKFFWSSWEGQLGFGLKKLVVFLGGWGHGTPPSPTVSASGYTWIHVLLYGLNIALQDYGHKSNTQQHRKYIQLQLELIICNNGCIEPNL